MPPGHAGAKVNDDNCVAAFGGGVGDISESSRTLSEVEADIVEILKM